MKNLFKRAIILVNVDFDLLLVLHDGQLQLKWRHSLDFLKRQIYLFYVIARRDCRFVLLAERHRKVYVIPCQTDLVLSLIERGDVGGVILGSERLFHGCIGGRNNSCGFILLF